MAPARPGRTAAVAETARSARPTQGRDAGTIRFREARPEDRPELQHFYEAFEPKRAAQGLPPIGSDRISRWLDSILHEGIHLIAHDQGELIGHAFLMPTGRAEECEYAVFIRQDMRGKGLGTRLNRASIEAARAGGYGRIWLSVTPHNRAAIRSYEKAGFRFIPSTIYSPEAEMELAL